MLSATVNVVFILVLCNMFMFNRFPANLHVNNSIKLEVDIEVKITDNERGLEFPNL